VNHRLTAIVLLGLLGAGVEMSCAPEPWSCPDDGKDHLCNICPGACRRVLNEYITFNPEYFPLLVWMGKEEDAPRCEYYGMAPMARWGIELREDASCPPCACREDESCQWAAVRYRSGTDCDGEQVRQPVLVGGFQSSYRAMPDCEELATGDRGLPIDAYGFEPVELWPSCKGEEGQAVPGETWKTVAVECSPNYQNTRDLPSVTWGCPEDEKGPRACLFDRLPVRDGFRACIWGDSESRYQNPPRDPADTPACPLEYPNKTVAYETVDGCGECQCAVEHEPACSLQISIYGDDECTELLDEENVVSSWCTGGQAALDARRYSIDLVRRHDEPCLPTGRTYVPLGTPVRPGRDWVVYCCEDPIGPPDDP
jgi:hypothetical protein